MKSEIIPTGIQKHSILIRICLWGGKQGIYEFFKTFKEIYTSMWYHHQPGCTLTQAIPANLERDCYEMVLLLERNNLLDLEKMEVPFLEDPVLHRKLDVTWKQHQIRIRAATSTHIESPDDENW